MRERFPNFAIDLTGKERMNGIIDLNVLLRPAAVKQIVVRGGLQTCRITQYDPSGNFLGANIPEFSVPGLSLCVGGGHGVPAKQFIPGEFSFHVQIVIIWNISASKLPKDTPQFERVVGDRIFLNREQDLERMFGCPGQGRRESSARTT